MIEQIMSVFSPRRLGEAAMNHSTASLVGAPLSSHGGSIFRRGAHGGYARTGSLTAPILRPRLEGVVYLLEHAG